LEDGQAAGTIIFNGRIATQDLRWPIASAVAMKGDRFIAVGSDNEALGYRGS